MFGTFSSGLLCEFCGCDLGGGVIEIFVYMGSRMLMLPCPYTHVNLPNRKYKVGKSVSPFLGLSVCIGDFAL